MSLLSQYSATGAATGPGAWVGPDPHTAPPSGFWAELARTRAELDRIPDPDSTTTAVVGPLGVAVPVARRLQRSAGTGPCDVMVLSPRAELVCEPSWTLVRNGTQLAEAAHRPSPAILVIDVNPPLPLWVGPLLDRLRRAGLGLVHYAAEEVPDDAELAGAAEVLGLPLALDLASPVEPARLVDLIDRGHRLASVRGVPLSAEVVVAARSSCGRR